MHNWVRLAAVTVIGGIFGGGACSGTGTVNIPRQECVLDIYYGGGAPTPHPDGPTLCAAGPCNYQTQLGCAAGETCWPHIDTVKGTVTPVCRAGGSQKKGETCDDQKPCSPGLYCAEGACRTMCCGADWSACSRGESCFHQAEAAIGESLIYAGFDLCFPVGTCDVLDPTSCSPVGQVCRVVDPTGAVACTPQNDLDVGAACDRLDQCNAGMICAGLSGPTNGTCRRLCRWAACGDPGCSAKDGDCVHFTRDPDGVGECTPDWQGAPVVSDGGVLYAEDGGVVSAGDAGTTRPNGGAPD